MLEEFFPFDTYVTWSLRAGFAPLKNTSIGCICLQSLHDTTSSFQSCTLTDELNRINDFMAQENMKFVKVIIYYNKKEHLCVLSST